MTKDSPIFYGWWIILAALGIMFVQAGTGFYSFGVLFKPLTEEFEWSRGVVSVAQSIFMVMAGVGGLVVSRLVERYRIERIVMVGSVVGGICWLLLSLTPNLWYLYALYFVIGAGMGGGAGFVPLGVVIANWFIRRRGTAMGIATVGIAMGAMLLTPLVGIIVENFGWRMAYIFNGLIVLAIGIPLALVLRTRPEDKGLLPDGDRPSEMMEEVILQSSTHYMESGSSQQNGGLTVWLRTLPMWLLCLGFALAHTAEISILVHEVPFITDMGIPVTAAAAALGFTGGMGGVGKITFGWLTDRLSTRYVVILCFLFQLVGALILMRTNTMAMVWLFVVIFGFAMGGMVTLMPLAIGDRFGTVAFGRIFGFVNLVVMLFSTAGPPFAGFMFDATGSYSTVLTTFAIAYTISVVAIYFTWGVGPRPLRSLRGR